MNGNNFTHISNGNNSGWVNKVSRQVQWSRWARVWKCFRNKFSGWRIFVICWKIGGRKYVLVEVYSDIHKEFDFSNFFSKMDIFYNSKFEFQIIVLVWKEFSTKHHFQEVTWIENSKTSANLASKTEFQQFYRWNRTSNKNSPKLKLICASCCFT